MSNDQFTYTPDPMNPVHQGSPEPPATRTRGMTADGYDPLVVPTHLEPVDNSADARTFTSPVRLYVGESGDLTVTDCYGNDVELTAVAVGWLPCLIMGVAAAPMSSPAAALVAGHCSAEAQLDELPE